MAFKKELIKTAAEFMICPSYALAKVAVSGTRDYFVKKLEVVKKLEEMKERFNNLFEIDEYEQALKLIDEIREYCDDDIDNIYWCYKYKAMGLVAYGKSKEIKEEFFTYPSEFSKDCYRKAKIALDTAEEYLDCFDEPRRTEERCWILYLRSFCQGENNKGGSRKYLIGAMKTNNDEMKNDILKEYRTCTSNMEFLFEDYKEGEADWNHPDVSEEDREECKKIAEANKFTNINSIDRQLIFVGRDDDHIAGCYDPSNNINWVFTLDYIPSDIKFPIGHPQANTLYIAHPVNKELYIPFEGASYNFFIDKVHELCYLLQCLGATEISFKSIKGREATLEENTNWNIGGEVGTKKYGKVGGQYGQGMGSSSYQSKHSEMGLIMTANPKEQPFCPNDLKWLDTETQWKKLIDRRLNGNLLTYEQRISTKSVSNISNNQRVEIKGAYENFMVCVNANYDRQTDTTLKETEETEWQICAKFKPLDEYDIKGDTNIAHQIEESTNNDTTLSTENEQSYAEEVKFYLEVGAIGETERGFLERKRTKLGISMERAMEIEKSLQEPQLTKNEQEYLDAVKDGIVDGEIPEFAKRLLGRLRLFLDISEERAAEIEQLAIQ